MFRNGSFPHDEKPEPRNQRLRVLVQDQLRVSRDDIAIDDNSRLSDSLSIDSDYETATWPSDYCSIGSDTEVESDESEADYDGIAQMFELPKLPKPASVYSETNNFDTKSEREQSRFRDAHNKQKMANKQHRFENNILREEKYSEKMAPKLEDYTAPSFKTTQHARLFKAHEGRNTRHHNAVKQAMKMDTASLVMKKK